MFGQSKKSLSCWILVCSVLICAASYGQTPAPTVTSDKPKPQATKAPKKADADQRGTEQSPLVIKILPTANGEQKTAQMANKQEADAPTDWGLITNVLLALFTGGLFIATYKLWQATERLVKGAEETARRQLRAYVYIDKAQITGLNSGDTPTAHLVVKNSGQTPAYDLTQMGGIALGISFETLSPATGSHRMSRSSLPAGADTVQFHIAPRPLTSEEMAALRNGTMTLFVYGEIRYRDTFKNRWITPYRFQTGGAVGVHGTVLAICEEGNKDE